MKRSDINRAIEMAIDTLGRHSFHLPPFAHWAPDEWARVGPECERVKRNGLGWDVSDFDGGDFDGLGAVLFTLRNGNHSNPELGTPYAEKVIILKPGQHIPIHFHWSKTEDIINRGGGILVMEMHLANDDAAVDDSSPIRVFCDGRERVLAAGELLKLQPGESITVTPRIYHTFWAHEDCGVLVCGEVSTINDDLTDNCFAQPITRFVAIEEDEAPKYLLCNEYPGGGS